MLNIFNSPPRPKVAGNAVAATGGLGRTFILALGTFAVGTDAFIVNGFLPEMASGFDVSAAAAGQSVTAFALTYAILAPVIATATATIPRRALLVAALLGLGLANLASALSPTLPALIVARMFAAATAAAYTPNAAAVATMLARPEQRARALSVVIGGLTIATVLGVPIGRIASIWLGWREALGLVAVLSCIAAIGVFSIMPSLPGNPRVPLGARLALLRRPGVLAVLPLTLIGMAACTAPFAYTIPVLNALSVPHATIALMLFVYGIGAVIGNFSSGYGTDRWGAKRVLVTAYVALAGSLGGMAWLAVKATAAPIATGLLMLGWGASGWAQTPAQQHRLIATAPQEAPLVVALNSSGIYFGIALGTALGGVAMSASITAVLESGLALSVLSLVFLAMTTRS